MHKSIGHTPQVISGFLKLTIQKVAILVNVDVEGLASLGDPFLTLKLEPEELNPLQQVKPAPEFFHQTKKANFNTTVNSNKSEQAMVEWNEVVEI